MGRMEVGFWMSTFASLLAGFLAGIFGSMGLGGGSILIIYLTVFAGVEQLTAQGINLIFFLPTAAVALFIYSKKGIIKWRRILPIMLLGSAGTLISGFFIGIIKGGLIKKLFGIVIIFYGLFEILGKNKK